RAQRPRTNLVVFDRGMTTSLSFGTGKVANPSTAALPGQHGCSLHRRSCTLIKDRVMDATPRMAKRPEPYYSWEDAITNQKIGSRASRQRRPTGGQANELFLHGLEFPFSPPGCSPNGEMEVASLLGCRFEFLGTPLQVFSKSFNESFALFREDGLDNKIRLYL